MCSFLCFKPWLFCPVRRVSNRRIEITIRDIDVAEKLFGLEFSNAERDSMLRSVNQNLESFHAIHEYSLENKTAPSLVFNPIPHGFRHDPG